MPPCTCIPAMPSCPSDTPGCICNALMTSLSPNKTGVFMISCAVSFFAPISAVSTAGASRRDVTTTSSSIFGTTTLWLGKVGDVTATEGLRSCFFALGLRLRRMFLPLISYSISESLKMIARVFFNGLFFTFTDTRISFSSSDEYTKFLPVCSTMLRNTTEAGWFTALIVTFCAMQTTLKHNIIDNTNCFISQQLSFVSQVFR